MGFRGRMVQGIGRLMVSVTPRFENISRFILAIGGQLWPI